MSMAPPESTVVNPYATTPGSSTPGRGISPEEGSADLWTFFWLSAISTVILIVVAAAGWLLVHH
ncbi:MAG: hypothetical protein L3K01_08580 [Thermoplasmata archaeon]|nr:hypothetical protein [Thermoplasmata archaeon]MCI4333753.1 hypothetical protein [Thermoplasmata archaeon]